MEIKYDRFGKVLEGDADFCLTSSTGCFLALGRRDFCKYYGYFFRGKGRLYKIVDDFVLATDRKVKGIINKDFSVKRVYESTYGMVKKVPLSSKAGGEIIGIEYGDEGLVEEVLELEEEVSTEEEFFVGLTGGLEYFIDNFYGEVYVDLDVRKADDFGEWGRIYDVKIKDDNVIVKFSKGEDVLYVIFRIPNSKIKLLNEWIKKEYSYDKRRGSLSEWYVYRAFKFKVVDYKRVIVGVGFSEEEALKEVRLLEFHSDEMKRLKGDFLNNLVKKNDFVKPLPEKIYMSYFYALKGVYDLMVKDFSDGVTGFYAGLPWFTQFWARDTLVSLRPLINDGEWKIAKDVLYSYFDNIDDEGVLKVFDGASSGSLDAVFWLVKRFFDLFFAVDEKKKLWKFFTEEELRVVYDKLKKVLKGIKKTRWDSAHELVRVSWGETWMDTVPRTFPLEIQVMMCELFNGLAVLASVLDDKKEAERFEDLEVLMRSNIRDKYFRNGMLYDEPFEDKVTNNIFLAYYFLPDLFFGEDWERIFDKTISHLWCDWGGFSSLSKKDSRFKGKYTGENNLSYHQGDSWFFVNNIAAISLSDLDYRKYKDFIDNIVRASSDDILMYGFSGFASEISSASEYEPAGCFAQLWSCATFVEMVDKLFGKKR